MERTILPFVNRSPRRSCPSSQSRRTWPTLRPAELSAFALKVWSGSGFSGLRTSAAVSSSFGLVLEVRVSVRGCYPESFTNGVGAGLEVQGSAVKAGVHINMSTWNSEHTAPPRNPSDCATLSSPVWCSSRRCRSPPSRFLITRQSTNNCHQSIRTFAQTYLHTFLPGCLPACLATDLGQPAYKCTCTQAYVRTIHPYTSHPIPSMHACMHSCKHACKHPHTHTHIAS